MGWIVRGVIVLVGLLAFIVGLEIVASESGEVVVLTTTSADGGTDETRLWVVDHDGAQWLRAGHGGSSWYRALETNPRIAVVRAGRRAEYRAVPTPKARAAINAAMSDKYGWADAYIGFLFGRDDTIPILLRPAA